MLSEFLTHKIFKLSEKKKKPVLYSTKFWGDRLSIHNDLDKYQPFLEHFPEPNTGIFFSFAPYNDPRSNVGLSSFYRQENRDAVRSSHLQTHPNAH